MIRLATVIAASGSMDALGGLALLVCLLGSVIWGMIEGHREDKRKRERGE